MNKTLRLVYPQWQGGGNPNYAFGCELLSHIAPPSETAETVTVKVNCDFNGKLKKVDGIVGGDEIFDNMKTVKKILNEKQPDKVIVYGGDCSITQAPFDYLSGKYGDRIGIIWLDAHPDISDISESEHMNECVLGNLLGRNQRGAVTHVDNVYTPERVILAGLIEEDLRDMDKGVRELGIKIVTPEILKRTSRDILDWIDDNSLKYVAIHWDLDVTSPDAFRSTYPTEPFLDRSQFPAAIGRMNLDELAKFFHDVSGKAEIAGLNITEHMPWDAINLRKLMEGISIFKD